MDILQRERGMLGSRPVPGGSQSNRTLGLSNTVAKIQGKNTKPPGLGEWYHFIQLEAKEGPGPRGQFLETRLASN